MKVCGLTGGVGMGKSTAASFFLKLGVRVVDTDEIARQLVQPGQPALLAIQNQFGHGVIATGGELRRDELARIVFADALARQKLESILHPLIRQCWLAQIEKWRQANDLVALVVIPLLFETQAETSFEKIICVACSPVAQQERLQTRGWKDDQIVQRIAAQMPVEQKIARSDFVVWTEGSPVTHEQQVTRVFQQISRF
jgi:dephospho-CoA kinase